MAEAISQVIGKKVAYVHIPPEYAKKQLLADGLPRWLADDLLILAASFREGYGAAVTNTVAEVDEEAAAHLPAVRQGPRARVLRGEVRPGAVLLVLAMAEAARAADPGSPFGAPSRIALGAGRKPTAIATGDFNRDGKMDVVVASEGANDVVVLLGDGRGGFRIGASAPAGSDPTEIFVGDFNRDGAPDLAIPDHDTHFVTILIGDGKGGFRAGPGLAAHGPQQAASAHDRRLRRRRRRKRRSRHRQLGGEPAHAASRRREGRLPDARDSDRGRAQALPEPQAGRSQRGWPLRHRRAELRRRESSRCSSETGTGAFRQAIRLPRGRRPSPWASAT